MVDLDSKEFVLSKRFLSPVKSLSRLLVYDMMYSQITLDDKVGKQALLDFVAADNSANRHFIDFIKDIKTSLKIRGMDRDNERAAETMMRK